MTPWTRRRRMPALNTTATADISFMLLIFFLVTTSLDGDKGIVRQLPPEPKAHETEPLRVADDDLLRVSLDAQDVLFIDGEPASDAELKRRIEHIAALRPETHVVAIKVDRNTSYEAYFHMQNTIVSAYRHLRSKGINVAMRVSESEEGGQR